MERVDVAVIGAGPGGLAAAAALKQVGIDALVLDREPQLGASWRRHYERLHLHTTRSLSALPGLPISKAYGSFVARADVVRYLDDYARHHALAFRFGTAVERLERADAGWRLITPAGALAASSVVVATGYSNAPHLPDWRGRATFPGELIHASAYRNASPYRGKDVLVVGTGNTGAEIAVDLVEGGAASVKLSARTPPNIVPRQVAGIPTQALGILLRPLPAWIVDPIVAVFSRITLGDLTRYGVPKPPRGMYTQVLRDGVLPILDVGLVAALKRGQVELVQGVEGFEGADVLLTGGRRVRPQAVVAATGYRRGLEELCGHLGVLDPRGCPTIHGSQVHPDAPGVYFAGFTNPVSGALRELAKQSVRISRAIRRAHSTRR